MPLSTYSVEFLFLTNLTALIFSDLSSAFLINNTLKIYCHELFLRIFAYYNTIPTDMTKADSASETTMTTVIDNTATDGLTDIDSACSGQYSSNKLINWYEEVRRHLLSGYTVSINPRGYSMWPTLRPDKDTIYIRSEKEYHRSDIVLAFCHTPRGVYLHRIAKVLTDGYVLMGDSNLYQTETCSHSGVIGKVISISREGLDITDSMSQKFLSIIQCLPHPLRRLTVRIINLNRNGI